MTDDDSESISIQSNFKLPENITQEDIEKKAIDLVRLAISNNVSDVPLKREEIRKKVIKDNMRIFPVVFEEAQKILRNDYCMELVEYPTRGTKIHSLNKETQRDTQVSQASTSTQTQNQIKRSKKYTTKSYILRSLIPGNFRKGFIFEKEDYQLHGLLIIILCLIYVNGNHLKEDALYKYLEKFGISKNKSHKVFGDVEKNISQFTQKGYLEKEKSVVPNEEIFYNYKWGPRALVEFPENNLLKFVKGFYNENEHEQIVRELIRSRGIN
ncbi:MAGE-domain-containing protein [Piromyces finnis]|uniref:MAGE-domain-containing protein n=1 Tax=Piromyces finnis TaxID=1754191 RepID=A0A1Y1UMR7_9FUNG|nr:MAGE-domain-containing protein [Piromyces finnis]|eukprot:ORX38784.1 MAGE-domain-containing protein [Piromyces finnis]